MNQLTPEQRLKKFKDRVLCTVFFSTSDSDLAIGMKAEVASPWRLHIFGNSSPNSEIYWLPGEMNPNSLAGMSRAEIEAVALPRN